MGLAEEFGTQRNQVQKKVAEFRRMKNRNKAAERSFERKYLKPDTIRPYAGVEPSTDEITRLTVRFVFHKRRDLERFKQFFKTSSYKENNVTDLGLLMAFISELEKGNITYDEKEKTIAHKHPEFRRRHHS